MDARGGEIGEGQREQTISGLDGREETSGVERGREGRERRRERERERVGEREMVIVSRAYGCRKRKLFEEGMASWALLPVCRAPTGGIIDRGMERGRGRRRGRETREENKRESVCVRESRRKVYSSRETVPVICGY
jgi:hypothetical protein